MEKRPRAKPIARAWSLTNDFALRIFGRGPRYPQSERFRLRSPAAALIAVRPLLLISLAMSVEIITPGAATAVLQSPRPHVGNIMQKQESMDSSAELRAMIAERRQASLEGDVEKTASSMAAEYVQTDISGYRQGKAAWLNEYFKPLAKLIKARQFHWDVYDQKDIQIQIFGDCAVVTGKLEAKGTGARFGPKHTWVPDPGESFSGTLNFTQVYIRRDGKWLLAALQNAVALAAPEK